MVVIYTSTQTPFLEGAEARILAAGHGVLFIPVGPQGPTRLDIPEAILPFTKAMLFDGKGVTASYDLSVMGDWARTHEGMPVVVATRQVPGIPSLMPDTGDAIYRLACHLAREHGVRRPVYLGGSLSTQPGRDRLEGFLRAAREWGWPTEGRALEGQFQIPAGRAQAERILAEGLEPDGIIAASDKQALGVKQIFEARGLPLPPITGFDNTLTVLHEFPGLTTALFDERLLGWESAGLVLSRMAGAAHPETTVLQNPLVIRSSCGCHGGEGPFPWQDGAASTYIGDPNLCRSLAAVTADAHRDPGPCLEAWSRACRSAPHPALFQSRARAFLASCDPMARSRFSRDFDERLQSLEAMEVAAHYSREANHHLEGLNRFINQLGHEPSRRNLEQNLKDLFGGIESQEQIFSLQTDEGTEVPLPGEAIHDLALRAATSGHGATLTPVEWNGRGLGAIVFRPSNLGRSMVNTLRVSVAHHLVTLGALKKETVARERLQDAVDLLEQYNLHLVEKNEKDPMTGLLNRKGFLKRGQPLWERSREKGRPCVILFADLDGLKGINDHFGHGEGDRAILAASQCLAKALRKTDLCCRLGGDEFAALLIGVDRRAIGVLQKRLALLADEWNRDHPGPWKLQISLGGCQRPERAEGATAGTPATPFTLADHMALADENLYEQKKARKLRRGEIPQ